VADYAVIERQFNEIEAFVLTYEVITPNDEEYATIIHTNEKCGNDICRIVGWYINGMNAKRIFISGEADAGWSPIPYEVSADEVSLTECQTLCNGKKLLGVEWSFSHHNSGVVYYEVYNNDLIYAFSGNNTLTITEEGKILSCDYYYDSFTNTEQWDYTEYVYENGELIVINSWSECA